MKRSTRVRIPKRLHPSSPLHLSLVRRALSDPDVQFVRRGVDARWHYQEHVSMAQTGFQPALGRIFYPTNSAVDAWLGDVGGDPRPHNFADRLMNELFFLVHDYLHILGYRWINGLMPELGFGTAEITEKNAESFVFCHLLTEAVATVGLDYWYLSRLNLYEELQIGTGFSGLTVAYRTSHDAEYRRFDPTFEVQSTAFFERICRFYCTGEFEGFGKEDLVRSPLLYNWLQHELTYGTNQRRYTRGWISYLSKENISVPTGGLEAQVSVRERWKKRLIREVGERLWAVVHGDQAPTDTVVIDPQSTWVASDKAAYNFRFLNWNRVAKESAFRKKPWSATDDDDFRYWYRQFLSRYPHDLIPPELIELRNEVLSKYSVQICEYLFRDFEPLPVHRLEPRTLFMLS